MAPGTWQCLPVENNLSAWSAWSRTRRPSNGAASLGEHQAESTDCCNFDSSCAVVPKSIILLAYDTTMTSNKWSILRDAGKSYRNPAQHRAFRRLGLAASERRRHDRRAQVHQ